MIRERQKGAGALSVSEDNLMIELEKISETEMSLSVPYSMRGTAKALGDYRWDKALKKWCYPIDAEKIALMNATIPGLKTDLDLLRIQDREEEQQEKLKEIKEFSPEHCKKLLDDRGYVPKVYAQDMAPFDHQYVAVVYGLAAIHFYGGYLLLDEMGVGKTPETLWAIEYLIKKGEIKEVYWFTPKGAKRSTLKKVALFTNLVAVSVEGTKAQRASILSRRAQIYIMNYAIAGIFEKELVPRMKGQAVVIDEIQIMRNPKPVKFSKVIFSAVPKVKIGLTGTPVHNVPENLFMLIQWIRKSWRNRWSFFKRHIEYGGWQGHEIVGYKNMEQLATRLDGISIRRIKDECLDLPAKTWDDKFLLMEGAQKKAYDLMKEECLLMWDDASDDDIRLGWANIKAQMTRLSQIADGFLSEGPDGKNEWIPGNCKERELDELLRDYPDKIVVWGYFVYPIKHLYEKYKDKYGAVMLYGGTSERDREAAVDRFQTDPSCRVFIGQMGAGGVAIDLTAASLHVFWKQSFVWSDNAQAEDRSHRIGMQDHLTIVRLIAEGTIDEFILKRSRHRQATARHLQGDFPKLNKELLLELFQ